MTTLQTKMAADLDAIRAGAGESIVYTPTSGSPATFTFDAMIQRVQFNEGHTDGVQQKQTGIIVTHPKSINAEIDLRGTYTFETKTFKILDVIFQNAVVQKVRAIYTGNRQMLGDQSERRAPTVFD